MNPSIDDRLSSIVRALTDIILPALPADAGLAREQLQLCVGHLGILRNQIDRAEAFEQEAAENARRLAADLLREAEEAGVTTEQFARLRHLTAEDTGAARQDRINHCICDILRSDDLSRHPPLSHRLKSLVIASEQARATKDRLWFAAMGFDREFST